MHQVVQLNDIFLDLAELVPEGDEDQEHAALTVKDDCRDLQPCMPLNSIQNKVINMYDNSCLII